MTDTIGKSPGSLETAAEICLEQTAVGPENRWTVPESCIQICVCMADSAQWELDRQSVLTKKGDTCLLPGGCRCILRELIESKDDRECVKIQADTQGADERNNQSGLFGIVTVTVSKELLLRDCIGVITQSQVLSRLTVNREKKQQPVVLHGNRRGKLEHIVKDMYYEYRGRQLGYEASLRGMLLRLLVMLSRAASLENKQEEDGEAAQDEKLAAEIFRYLDDNFAEATLQETAAHFYYHPNTINRLLLRISGKTFCEVVREVRMRHARQLLAETDLSVQQIARTCGYKNMTHFYHMFDRECAMTPYEYRNGTRQDKEVL